MMTMMNGDADLEGCGAEPLDGVALSLFAFLSLSPSLHPLASALFHWLR